jgi:hypothetical protein
MSWYYKSIKIVNGKTKVKLHWYIYATLATVWGICAIAGFQINRGGYWPW